MSMSTNQFPIFATEEDIRAQLGSNPGTPPVPSPKEGEADIGILTTSPTNNFQPPPALTNTVTEAEKPSGEAVVTSAVTSPMGASTNGSGAMIRRMSVGLQRVRDSHVDKNVSLVKDQDPTSLSPDTTQTDNSGGSQDGSGSSGQTKKEKPIYTLKSLAKMMEHGSALPPVFALFGSFERANIFHELIVLCGNPMTKQFIEELINAVDDIPQDLITWVSDRSQIPPNEYFAQPIIAWPLHTMISLACFYTTAKSVKYFRMKHILKSGGLISTGKGLLAALAVATSETEEQFKEAAQKMCAMACQVGALYQRHCEALAATLQHSPRRTFSLLLVNIPMSALQLLIAEANQVRDNSEIHEVPLSELQICRVISSRSCVVCGHPLDLLRLDVLLVKFANETGVKIHKDYLPAIVPENSPHFNQQLQLELVHILRASGLMIDSEDLKVPIFSPINGTEWSTSKHLMMEVVGALTCVPQDLTYSLQHLRETDTIFDFSVSGLSIGQMIAWTKKSVTIIGQPSDKVEVSSLPSPRRSAQGKVMRNTMKKCAILNDIFSKIKYVGKPKRVVVNQLFNSFVDCGLLLDLDRLFAKEKEKLEMLLPGSPEASIAAVMKSSITSGPLAEASLAGRALSPKLFAMSVSTVTAYVSPAGANEVESKAFHAAHNLVVMPPAAKNGNIVNVYQVSPLITYLEQQHRCILTEGAVDFAKMLEEKTKLPFPPHTLLMCPTVFALLELWDAYEFQDRLETERKEKRTKVAANDPLARSAAIIRRQQLKHLVSTMHSSTSPITAHNPATSMTSPPGYQRK